MVAAGYDRTFDEVAADGPEARPAACGGGVTVTGSRIELEPGVRLDFGGIGKGWAADRAAELLSAAGPCLVNAGGDIAVRGGAWPVGVQTATGSLTVELTTGGLATSGRDRRALAARRPRAAPPDRPARPAPRPRATSLRATVIAGDAVSAEVWSKALYLRGSAAAAEEADRRGLPAVLVTTDGDTRLAGGLA